MGPYSEAKPLIPGSGPVVLFDAGEKGLMASCSITDTPVLIPLKLQGASLAAAAVVTLPAAPKAARASKLEMYDYARSKPSGTSKRTVAETGRSYPTPLFDLPMADLSIVRGDGDIWYLTGTVASKFEGGATRPDFANNDGIYLWQSTDLETWTPMGKVWDIEKDGSAWTKAYRIPGDNPVRADFCRGVTAPEISFSDGAFWIAYSINGRGTGLLKSKTGKAEGPYEDIGRITALGESPSLFIDKTGDGGIYWLWGKGLQCARMKPGRDRLDSGGVDLYLSIIQDPNIFNFSSVDLWDVTAPHLFVIPDAGKGKPAYSLTFSAVTQTFSRANRDAVIAMADSLFGVYYGMLRMIPNGGQTSVFTGPGGGWYASFFGADPSAVFRDRPGIVPLEVAYPLYAGQRYKWPRRAPYDFYTERGPWAEKHVQPVGLEQFQWRDPFTHAAPNGFFYLTASPSIPAQVFEGGARAWRAKDILGPWEDLGFLYTMEQMRDDPNWPEIKDKSDLDWNNNKGAWEVQIEFAKGTYWMTCWFGGHGWGKDVCWKKSSSALLKSLSGKPEGPYKLHKIWGRPGLTGILEGNNEKVYLLEGACMITPLNNDLTEIIPKATLTLEKSVDGRQLAMDCGFTMHRIGKRYLRLGTVAHGTYDTAAFWSDSIEGPWHFMGVIPRLGNSSIVKNRDGKWYPAFPQAWRGANYDAPTKGTFTYELTVNLDGPSPSLWPTHDLDHLDQAIYRAP